MICRLSRHFAFFQGPLVSFHLADAQDAQKSRQENQGSEHAAGHAQGQDQAQAGHAAVLGDHHDAETQDGGQSGNHDAAPGRPVEGIFLPPGAIAVIVQNVNAVIP